MKNQKVLKTVLICIVAEIMNWVTTFVFYQTLQIPLFFDTIFTVAVVFYSGLVPGLCVSIVYNVLNSLIWTIRTGFFDPFILMYGICGILIVISTWVIARKKENFRINLPITLLYLLLISLVSSLCCIVSSGIIDYFHYLCYEITDQMNPIKTFTEGFVQQHFTLLASCILAQIPISFLDRLLATFSGYGIALLCEKVRDRS